MSGAYTHNGDRALMAELGLRTDGFDSEFTPLGTVVVEEAEPDGQFGPRPAVEVAVEVSALPAQFFRFTIRRPRDEVEDLPEGETDPHTGHGWRGVYEPVEVFVMTTGSGGFGDYWPIAKAVAQNMVNIKRQA